MTGVLVVAAVVGDIIEGKRTKKTVERLDFQAPKQKEKLRIGDGQWCCGAVVVVVVVESLTATSCLSQEVERSWETSLELATRSPR